MSSSEKFAAGTLYVIRNTMYDELHARPAVEIAPPSLLTHLAYTTGYGRTKDGNILLRKRMALST